MKFSGKISLINIMILSKFQVDCITLSNFGNFPNIGKYQIWSEIFLPQLLSISARRNIREFVHGKCIFDELSL